MALSSDLLVESIRSLSDKAYVTLSFMHDGLHADDNTIFFWISLNNYESYFLLRELESYYEQVDAHIQF